MELDKLETGTWMIPNLHSRGSSNWNHGLCQYAGMTVMLDFKMNDKLKKKKTSLLYLTQLNTVNFNIPSNI